MQTTRRDHQHGDHDRHLQRSVYGQAGSQVFHPSPRRASCLSDRVKQRTGSAVKESSLKAWQHFPACRVVMHGKQRRFQLLCVCATTAAPGRPIGEIRTKRRPDDARRLVSSGSTSRKPS